MAKFSRLNEEDDIKIEVIDDNNKEKNSNLIHIILRNAQSENMKYTVDKNKIKNVENLKQDVIIHKFNE